MTNLRQTFDQSGHPPAGSAFLTTLTSDSADTLSAWITLLLAFSCGLIVANIYYAQPLIGPISRELGLSAASAGLLVTMSQIGYGAGLLLIVPLGDLVENRKLVLSVVAVAAAALASASFATNATLFLTAALFIGLGSVAVQILIPYAAHLAPAETRGRAVGNVTTGLMLGVMLARPASSLVAAATAATRGTPELRPPARLDGRSRPHRAGAAPAWAVSGRIVWVVQPVLDHGAAAAGRS
jgi:MFS family permease